MGHFKDYLNQIESGKQLSFAQAKEFQDLILNNQFEEADLVKVFSAFEKRPLAYEELKGFYEASIEKMLKIETSYETLDICGTGGDQSGSFNVSTVAAIIASAAGVPVAKHGNRAASSLCGSADVLEALGLNIDLSGKQAEECLRHCGFVFLMAKNFHPAFKFAGPARKTFGKKTYFNILGPLLNPAGAKYRVHGFSDFGQINNLGRLLMESGVKKAWLIHSSDGLDEISPVSQTEIRELRQGEKEKVFQINPTDYGFENLNLVDIKGGTASVNAQIVNNILGGTANKSQTATAILNAAAGLVVYGKAENFGQGVEMAAEALNSGKALIKLQQMQAVCQKVRNNEHSS